MQPVENEITWFSAALAALDLSETELAVALLWYKTRIEGASEVSGVELARSLHELSLRGAVNSSRLMNNLARHDSVVRGTQRNSFKLLLSAHDKLNSQFEPLLSKPRPKVEGHIVPKEEFSKTRNYLETIVHQINGCYQFGFYDACLVLCRRLMESLLIEAFEAKGASQAIKHQGNYVQLSEIIAQARGGHHFRLARGTADILDEIKDVGDTAAHSRTYVSKQKDVDDVKIRFRRMISELAVLAGIKH